MGKPLLTDEILKRFKKGQKLEDTSQFGHYNPDKEVYLEPDDFQDYLDEEEYEGYVEGQTIRIPVQPSVVKSRRIETNKREAFRSKVNTILFWVVILVLLFIVAVIFW
ncbi:TPA: cell wall synthase accessory phosphoprotein MacP [Streptococcus suis]